MDKGVYFLVYEILLRNQDASFLFFGFRQPSAAPIATPTASHTGSLVAAKTAAPIAVPTPIKFPRLLELFNLLFILNRHLYLLHRDRVVEIGRFSVNSIYATHYLKSR